MTGAAEKIRLILPTRELEENYDTHTPLGRSLSLCPKLLMEHHPVERRIFGLGTKRALFGQDIVGLARMFNIAIRESATDPAILVFMHDDIEMRDFFWPYHVVDGLQHFDMIGLAGNTRRTARQSSWGAIGEDLTRVDREHHSGTVAHQSAFGLRINHFGPSHVECKFLDGLFLAVHSETLLRHGIFFDERFEFHFYDMDLCRQFETHGLRMGTWGISVVHNDNGSYASLEWKEGYEKYIEKWKW